MNIEKKMKFDLCWFAGAFAAMGLAFGACLIGTEMMSHGGNGNLQAMVSVALLTVFPFTLATLLAVAAWLARAYRAKLLGACVGFAVAGTVLTCVMLANANRRAAVLDMFQVHGAEGAEKADENIFRRNHAERSAANTRECRVNIGS